MAGISESIHRKIKFCVWVIAQEGIKRYLNVMC